MSSNNSEITPKCINTIRFLGVDAVQAANSGHPGIVMGCAPVAFLLFSKIMKHNPANQHWYNRDRFILSAGHGSMLLYSVLHLSGYDVSLDDLKNFRQWESITPGHPEYGLTPGVETTTGPLGQGFSNAVGMAAAEAFMKEKFNKEDTQLIDHKVYVLASDGDIMEGITHETSSFAGHNKLNDLIVFYDNNNITIDGKVSLAMSEDVAKRYEAYGWYVQRVKDVNVLDVLEKAIQNAQDSDKPNLIILDTHIGYGSPNKQDTADVHGSPLGEEEIAITKKNLGWDGAEPFHIPKEVYDYFTEVKENGEISEAEWNVKLDNFSKKYPMEAKLFKEVIAGDFGSNWKDELPKFENYGEKIATRKASGKVINAIASQLPTMIGGSADLTGSNSTLMNDAGVFSADDHSGRYVHYGIREHAMAGILNGMCLYGGVVPFGGTFLVFSDYMRPSIRLASLSGLRPIYVFTHDSIGLGEDGPTHQPVEHLSALRAVPGLKVVRPADANETSYAWQLALEHKGSPVALVLTRQKLPIINRSKYAYAEGTLKGAYVISDSEGEPEVILIATGSEVSICLEAADKLKEKAINCRVVSMPSWEVFDEQSGEYKEKVLPSSVKAKLSVETGVKHGWQKYVGESGDSVSLDRFGASAPYTKLYEEFGVLPENIAQKAEKLVKERNVSV